MGLFGSNNPYEETLTKLTSELNTETDWGQVLELCDKIKASSKGPQDFCNIIFSKLTHRVPHVSMQAMTVLDACVSNCGKEFHKEMASQNFTESIREFLYSNKNPKVIKRMRYLVRKWAEEFKNDPSLAHFVSIYYYLRGEGMQFPEEDESDPQARKTSQAPVSTNPDAVSSQQEADDIAKAIEASLNSEKSKGKRKNTSSQPASSLYPSMTNTSSSPASSSVYAPVTTAVGNREKRLVKALYDFEAVEENELTFHTGDVINILDDSDVNWWKGEGSHGVGLFPANFVTTDMNTQVAAEAAAASAANKVMNTQQVIAATPQALVIDEDLIDKTLLTLQNTDPEMEDEDPSELIRGEETCRQMEKLIDSKLEGIDREHLDLTMLNEKILESLRMYDTLMKEMPMYNNNPQMLKMGGSSMVNMQQQQQQQQQQPYQQMNPYQPYGHPSMTGMDPSQMVGGMPQNMMPPHMAAQYNPMYQQMGPQQMPGQPQQMDQQQQQGFSTTQSYISESAQPTPQLSSTTIANSDTSATSAAQPLPSGAPAPYTVTSQYHHQHQQQQQQNPQHLMQQQPYYQQGQLYMQQY